MCLVWVCVSVSVCAQGTLGEAIRRKAGSETQASGVSVLRSVTGGAQRIDLIKCDLTQKLILPDCPFGATVYQAP